MIYKLSIFEFTLFIFIIMAIFIYIINKHNNITNHFIFNLLQRIFILIIDNKYLIHY